MDKQPFSGEVMMTDTMRYASITRARELLSPKAGGGEYPVDALGPLSAVAQAIAEGVQCDPALAGQSVLSAAALLTQSVANVRSADGASKPLSLYALSIASSGDGKDSADRIACHAIREWQRAAERAYRLAMAKRGRDDAPPPEPYRVTSDITLEGLRRAYKEGLSSQGVFSTEAAVMLVGHAMNPENRLKTAAALCRLWDGGHLSVVRAGAERLERYGLRLSVHLMVQPAAVAETMSDERLAEIGFWPRFLMAWPPSLTPRRFRPFRPEESPVITAYWQRCEELAQNPPPRDNDTLMTMELDGSAAIVLGNFLEECEQRARRGDWQPIRPFALRGAELAVRIAGVQVAFAGECEVDAGSAERGIVLARHSLDNWRAVLEGGRVDPAVTHAMILYQWLLNHGKPIKPGDILRVGPGVLRRKGRRDAALERLAKAGLVAVQAGVVTVTPLEAVTCETCESCENPAHADFPGDAKACDACET